MADNHQNRPSKVTPLWIVAAFVTLTEVILGYAVTKTSGSVQVALTSFVILFALLIAAAFFWTLWDRPYVFYPPSEYSGSDPSKFILAMRSSIPARIAEELDSVRMRPDDEEAVFRLATSFIDDKCYQHLILMHEHNVILPYSQSQHFYAIEKARGGQVGLFDPIDFVRHLSGTEFISVRAQDSSIQLTDKEHTYASWLVKRDHKAIHFDTPFGGWGSADPNGFVAKEKQRYEEKKRTGSSTS